MNELRTCKICKMAKEVVEFPKNHYLYRYPMCKLCRNAYNRERRQLRPALYKAFDAKRRSQVGFKQLAALRNRLWYESVPNIKEKARLKAKSGLEFINDLKHGKPCADCGISYPPHVMDFDHVRGTKIAGVSKMRNWNQEKILAEMGKCDLVCSNCHRIRTYDRKQLNKAA